jgi:hypothetical protein
MDDVMDCCGIVVHVLSIDSDSHFPHYRSRPGPPQLPTSLKGRRQHAASELPDPLRDWAHVSQ